MDTKQRTRATATPPEESLDQKMQSLEMKMEQKFATMSICIGNMATFLTMQQERIRALEEQVYKEQRPGMPEKQPGVPPQEERSAERASARPHDLFEKKLMEAFKQQESGLPPQEEEQTKLATQKQRDYLQLLGVKDLASDLTKEHASVLIEQRLRELRAAKTAEPASQPDHPVPQRTTAHNGRQVHKNGGRSHGV